MNDMTVRGLAPPDLCRYLGLSPNLGLYEIFSYYFEGKVKNDSTMIKVLENAFLNDSPYYYCIKLGVTFCWFTLTDRIQIKGKLQFSEPPSIYTVGKFMKHLRYEIALSGANLTRVKYLIWDESDLVNFEKYIVTYDKFSDFFNRIEGCKGLTCINIMRLLSRVRNPKGVGINFNAETFVKCLIDSYSVLGIEERDGVLYSRNLFYKDYSICTSSIINYNGCSYGFIIDTEGVKGSNGSLSNGISELGGLIFCRYNNIIMNVIANILGLGNAATPLGLKAMTELQKENSNKDTLSDNMMLLIVLNTASLQIIPTTIIAIRSSLGSENPTKIIFPVWISTICAAVIGIICTKIIIKCTKK